MKSGTSLNRRTLRIHGPDSSDHTTSTTLRNVFGWWDHRATVAGRINALPERTGGFGISFGDLDDNMTNIALATTQLGEFARFYGQICDSRCRGAGPISRSRRCSQNVSRIDEARSNLT
jgi:hypothetical protein